MERKLFGVSLIYPYLCGQLDAMTTAKEIIAHMESLHNEEQRRVLMGFFKTGPGEYGEGDEFLGLKVPQTRSVVNAVWKDLPLSEVPELLMNRWHEVRLCGLLVLVAKFEKLATGQQLGPCGSVCTQDTGPLAAVAEQAGKVGITERRSCGMISEL